jgi:hypothetical protein
VAQAVCYSYGGVSLVFAVLWGILARGTPATIEAPKEEALATKVRPHSACPRPHAELLVRCCC